MSCGKSGRLTAGEKNAWRVLNRVHSAKCAHGRTNVGTRKYQHLLKGERITYFVVPADVSDVWTNNLG
jgi:hypothetical protein